MADFLTFAAVLGGTVLLVQLALMLLGGLSGSDTDTTHASAADTDLGTAHVDATAHDVSDMAHAATAGAKADMAAKALAAAKSTKGVGYWLGGLLNIRSIAAGLTFGGLSGLAAMEYGLPGWSVPPVALLAALISMRAMNWLYRQVFRLEVAGNTDLRVAIGRNTRVYLAIPGQAAGKGKVTITLPGGTIEADAITRGPDLPTGSEAVVVAIRGNTLIVEAED